MIIFVNFMVLGREMGKISIMACDIYGMVSFKVRRVCCQLSHEQYSYYLVPYFCMLVGDCYN